MWIRLYRFAAVLLVVLVAAQAVIAGQHLFGTWGIGVHAALGNAVFALVVAVAVLAFLRLDGGTRRAVAVVMVAVVTAQIGLGYSARSSLGAAAVHIPLGVLLFGAAVHQLVLAFPELVGRGQTRSVDAT